MPRSGDVAVVIPARNESDRIGATVAAAMGLSGVDIVVVVDDGSTDGTAAAAERAGASVMRHARNRGKAAAMETGAEAVRLLEQPEFKPPTAHQPGAAQSEAAQPGAAQSEAKQPGAAQSGAAQPGAEQPQARPIPHHLLFLDGDLGETAAHAGPLAEPVRRGEADMTIAVFSERVRQGGHGFVVTLSGAGIQRATGWRPDQPLNGQRCLTRAAFEMARPLATGFGVETALTIDLLRKRMRIIQVEVPLAHRATGADWRSQLHRARQFADVARALAVRQPGRRAARPARG
jgi:hypothetical protein